MQPFLWCAFSRLIITKQAGASLAMDLSHSRPHKVYRRAPISPLESFLESVDSVISAAPFANPDHRSPKARINIGDARRLAVESKSIDVAITSPPYLNAIDYVRCSKFSLVWMGHQVSQLRDLRSTTVGAEIGNVNDFDKFAADHIMKALPIDALPPRQTSFFRRYVNDMHRVIVQIARVLKPTGKAVFVIGDCSMKGTFVENSRVISLLAQRVNMPVISQVEREIPNNRRYLPPPSLTSNGGMDSRMRREVVLTLAAPQNN